MRRSPRIGRTCTRGTFAIASVLLALGCSRATDEPRAGGEPLSHWKREAKLVSFMPWWNSQNEERRHEAFAQLGKIGEPAVPVLVELFLDEKVPITGDALNALCALGPRASAAVPELARAVEQSARADAAWALGCIGPAAAAGVPALEQAARSPAPKLREAAARALSQIGGSGREALARAARDGDPAVRASAVTGLAPGGAGAAPPREYLAAALGDPAPEVRARAFEAANPRSRDEAVQMAELVQRGMHDESELVREAAHHWYTVVCQTQHDSAALHARIVAGGDPGSRIEAAWRLGSWNLEHRHLERELLAPEVGAALAAALADPEPVVRIYAARGLSIEPAAQPRLAGVLREAIAAPGADTHARVVGARHLFPLSRDPRDVESAYTGGLHSANRWDQLETLAAIREMGRDGAARSSACSASRPTPRCASAPAGCSRSWPTARADPWSIGGGSSRSVAGGRDDDLAHGVRARYRSGDGI